MTEQERKVEVLESAFYDYETASSNLADLIEENKGVMKAEGKAKRTNDDYHNALADHLDLAKYKTDVKNFLRAKGGLELALKDVYTLTSVTRFRLSYDRFRLALGKALMHDLSDEEFKDPKKSHKAHRGDVRKLVFREMKTVLPSGQMIEKPLIEKPIRKRKVVKR
ncbi:MAG: hypothetical protein KAW41_03635 [Candidatus Diapherotrites archaeon]|nr:hypothetical protein [Candidatus Diapherotrites archaeon]